MKNNEQIIYNTILKNKNVTASQLDYIKVQYGFFPYCTFNEWKNKGFSIKKGSKGMPVFLYFPQTKKDGYTAFYKKKTYIFDFSQVEKYTCKKTIYTSKKSYLPAIYYSRIEFIQEIKKEVPEAAKTPQKKPYFLNNGDNIEINYNGAYIKLYFTNNRLQKEVKAGIIQKIKKYGSKEEKAIILPEIEKIKTFTQTKEGKKPVDDEKPDNAKAKVLYKFTAAKSDKKHEQLKKPALINDGGKVYTVATNAYIMAYYKEAIEGIEKNPHYPNMTGMIKEIENAAQFKKEIDLKAVEAAKTQYMIKNEYKLRTKKELEETAYYQLEANNKIYTFTCNYLIKAIKETKSNIIMLPNSEYKPALFVGKELNVVVLPIKLQ